jgi:hypothetical protein
MQHSLFQLKEAVINKAIEQTHICMASVTLVHHHFHAVIKQAIERIHICKASSNLSASPDAWTKWKRHVSYESNPRNRSGF